MKKNILVFMLIAILCLCVACEKNDSSNSVNTESTELSLDTLEQQISYAMGAYYANLAGQVYSIDPELFGQGALDFANNNMRMTAEEQSLAFADFLYSDNLTSAEAFLEENAKVAGVVQTESGLQYKVSKQSNGIQAKLGDSVNVDYSLTLLDGTIVDSGKGVNFTLAEGGLIQGFLEGVCLMNVGSTATLYVHPDLGYGAPGSYTIEPYSLLIFEVTLNAIN